MKSHPDGVIVKGYGKGPKKPRCGQRVYPAWTCWDLSIQGGLWLWLSQLTGSGLAKKTLGEGVGGTLPHSSYPLLLLSSQHPLLAQPIQTGECWEAWG